MKLNPAGRFTRGKSGIIYRRYESHPFLTSKIKNDIDYLSFIVCKRFKHCLKIIDKTTPCYEVSIIFQFFFVEPRQYVSANGGKIITIEWISAIQRASVSGVYVNQSFICWSVNRSNLWCVFILLVIRKSIWRNRTKSKDVPVPPDWLIHQSINSSLFFIN